MSGNNTTNADVPHGVYEVGSTTITLCHLCGFVVDDKGICPNAVNHFVAELPPLGVHICDTAGVAGKVGK